MSWANYRPIVGCHLLFGSVTRGGAIFRTSSPVQSTPKRQKGREPRGPGHASIQFLATLEVRANSAELYLARSSILRGQKLPVMPLTAQQILTAEIHQQAAAHDASQLVRLVAGPGTGKSRSIEERICWLLASGIAPQSIYVVSFTRAASRDLQQRIERHCANNNQPGVAQVRVSTLHSLALRLLRAGGLLAAFPVGPYILDKWESENIIDDEFAYISGKSGGRCEDIRRYWEAFWSTGQWGPANYIPPNPPIDAAEQASFGAFHTPRTQTYCCVLPGELVRRCAEATAAGVLNPAGLLGIQQLVVDEYQDLNQSDIDFVEALIAAGVNTFAAGDDDQSIYSFRYAAPTGIELFPNLHPAATSHVLTECFRCAESIVQSANTLIGQFAMPNRITKVLVSMHAQANPPEQGVVHRWHFHGDRDEARAIAHSCRDLITAGVPARELLVLVSNTRVQIPLLRETFQTANVECEAPRAESFLDEDAGRFVLSILRIVCDPRDTIAHRILMGTLPGVGAGTCNKVADEVLNTALSYRDIFYLPLPAQFLTGRALKAVNRTRNICAQLAGWTKADTLAQRNGDLLATLAQNFDVAAQAKWAGSIGHLPPDITVEELRDYVWADNDEQQAKILERVYQRLNVPPPAIGFLPQKVRLMTMHGAKGLSATVVFVPGLEERILPGSKRAPYPGLVLEAARLLYVSITRARAACVLSYAEQRLIHGQVAPQTPCRFLTHTGGAFHVQNGGLTNAEVVNIVNSRANVI
jgi:DNA helicase-2/ATP-dependent DNA helicase PcrA